MIRFASDTLNSLACLAGLGVFIERDTSGMGPLAFAREAHPRDLEVWGLGLHVVVSRLPRRSRPA